MSSSLASDALLDLQDLGAPVGDLLLDLGSEPDRLLTRLDLRLAPERVGLARFASATSSWRVRRAAARREPANA